MRKVFFFIILIGCIQCTIRKPVVESKKTEVVSVVENKKLNVVYRGIRNPITVYMPNVDSIKVTGPGVHKVNENEYYISPGQGLKTEILIIGYIDGQEIVDKREFRILGIQEFYASIHKYFGNIKLSKEELADSKIKIHIPQFVMELPDVESFEYKINKENSLSNKGDTFSDFAKAQIYNLKKGDSVLIDNIKLVTDYPNVDRARIIELKVYIE